MVYGAFVALDAREFWLIDPIQNAGTEKEVLACDIVTFRRLYGPNIFT